METKPIVVTDVTLRDGHQQPGIAFTLEERIQIAEMLRDVGVDVIEAGFPANAYDMESVKTIAQKIDGPKISALARVVRSDIDAAYEALQPALKKGNAMLHLFIGTSDMLMENSVSKNPEEVTALVREMVGYASKKGFTDIQFSPEDATRTPIDYLDNIVKTAIDAGATRINIPDTVGYTIPMEYHKLIRHILDTHPKIKSGEVILSVHCHNDLGMAVANTLEGISSGAVQFEGTINGIGERAGNTDLFTVIMALRTRQDFYRELTAHSGTPHINSVQFSWIAKEVDRIAEMPTYANRPVTGTNAFRDSSGIHAAAVERNPGTYHIINALDVGAKIQIVIGPTSGTNIVNNLLNKYGYEVSQERLQELTEELKGYSIRIKDSLVETEALVYIKRAMGDVPLDDPVQLGNWNISTGSNKSHATVGLYANGQYKEISSDGVGAIDAATKAIIEALNGGTKDKIRLIKFEEVPTSAGSDAQAHARVALEYQGRTYWGRAREPDIVKAGVNAVVQALNAIYILDNPAKLNSNPVAIMPAAKI